MPSFETVTLDEAIRKTAIVGKRGEILREYLAYLDQLKNGQAGRLSPNDGETVGAVRRRLGAAARLVGMELVIKRAGEDIYFWAQPGDRVAEKRRPGRPRKIALGS